MTDKWEFNQDVTDIFDDMLIRSIPQYKVMRQAVHDLVMYFYDSKSRLPIIDLGCSRGESISNLLEHLNTDYIGLEISQPMLQASRERFKNVSNVEIREWDITKGLPDEIPNVYLSILTLQFTPINYRQQIIEEIYNKLPDNGMFILVEKILGNTSTLDKSFVNLYHSMKSLNGYTQEEITRKSLELEGVLVPVTADWNESLLRNAGFKTDCFWRWMNFAGWVGYKHG